MPKDLVLWLIVIDMALSGLYVIWRGLAEDVRRYDGWDAFFALIEVPLAIWGVFYIAS